MTRQSRELRSLLLLVSLAAGGCAQLTRPMTSVLPLDREMPAMPSEGQQPIVRGPVQAQPAVSNDAPVSSSVSTSARGPSSHRASSAPNAAQGNAPAATRTDNTPSTNAPNSNAPIVRGQNPSEESGGWSSSAEERYPRRPQRAAQPASSDDRRAPSDADSSDVEQMQYAEPLERYDQPYVNSPGAEPYRPTAPYQNFNGQPGPIGYGGAVGPPGAYQPPPPDMPGTQDMNGRYADLIVNVREQQTGRFMFGVGVNSDAGLTAQVVIDEYNFDWKRFPRSVDDVLNGTAWRGDGQRLRIEAIPGTQLQRYLVNFTEPYLFDTNISLNLSGFLYDRNYFDWDEQRLGGRVGLGYRLTPDLSLSANLRMENIDVSDPRVRGIPELEEVLGDNSLYSGRVTLTHDTRDSPFAATEGHMLELSFEQAFGTFNYPRGQVDYRRYFLISQRPDTSGRHVLGLSWQLGISGDDTPLFENFFAGGYSTLRGFRFRSAVPKSGDVYVGGPLSFLGSAEYMFPITADDMLKGVVFCDYGTIEEDYKFEKDDFRVALGAGLRISIPAMGPAPIALDFAVPIAREDTDRIQNFSFFVGFGR